MTLLWIILARQQEKKNTMEGDRDTIAWKTLCAQTQTSLTMPRKFNLNSNVDQTFAVTEKMRVACVSGRLNLTWRSALMLQSSLWLYGANKFLPRLSVCFETILHHTQSFFANCQIKTDLINRRRLSCFFALQEWKFSCSKREKLSSLCQSVSFC